MATLRTFLRKSGDIDDLERLYSIKARRHKLYNNLVLFKYSQINSPFKEKIVQESRGIILDEKDDWRIVSYPYDKFFNHGESLVADIDWNSSEVFEKLDGSLMTLYFYDDEWNVSSSGLPDASGPVIYGQSITFADLFWKVWSELGYNLPSDKDKCYIFEMMTPHNQIVVHQHENKIVLHGVRNLVSLKEEDPKLYSEIYGWDLVKKHNFSDFNEMVEFSKKLNPLESEGYVVRDGNWNRCKIKGIKYVRLAYISSAMDDNQHKGILKIIQENEYDEFLCAFPKYKNKFEKINKAYLAAFREIKECYESIKEIENRKQLALRVKDKWYSSCIFKIKGCVNPDFSIKNWLSSQDTKKLLKQLDEYGY